MTTEGGRRNARRVRLARSFATALKAQLGPQLRRVVLYGSVARGDDHSGSDIDLFVEVRRRTPALEQRVYEAVADVSTKDGELIVPLLLSSAERRQHLPRYLERTIRLEGKPLV